MGRLTSHWSQQPPRYRVQLGSYFEPQIHPAVAQFLKLDQTATRLVVLVWPNRVLNMKELLETYRKETSSFLLTLILLLLGWVFPGAVSASGSVTLSKEQAIKAVGMMGAVVIGILSYTYQLWRQERRREKVRSAHGLGAKVCWCSEIGSVMLVIDSHKLHTVFRCPSCKREIMDFQQPGLIYPKPREGPV